MGEDEEYVHFQHFLNVTASIATDISLYIFSEIISQVGTTLFGSLVEHCSTCPLWIRRRDGMVCVTPPNGKMYYNFAWRNHAAKKTNNNTNTAQQQNNQARDEQCERYNRNKDRAFEEHNFSPPNRTTGHRHWLHESLETRRHRHYGRNESGICYIDM